MLCRISLLCLALFALILAPLRPNYANEGRISLIRDTEIESTILAYATPLFEAAKLDPRAIRIYLVNDRQINAFVAGGQNLFLNTGLLLRSDDAGQVIGVIAHEAGHIEGGHLARIHDALKRGTAETIAAIVLGAAAAVAGRPDLGTAIALGGQDIALRNFLQYTRTQEGAADAAAMRYLDGTQQSARPLLKFFETLAGQELLSP
ncbi:MAG TPA: M48 family metalloprotease, partial [Candidatus Defluviicoccus seviourii]|nr:M48 family metalloprotease [Candidatus Defluviicoccus seviourii]